MAFSPVSNTLRVNNPEGFPTWALGPLERVVAEVQHQTSAPVSSIVAALIIVISLVSQGKIRIQKRGGLISPVSLWYIVIQESGERKSTVIKLLVKAVMEFLSELPIKHSKALGIYYAALDGWKAEGKGIQRKIRQKSTRGESVFEDQQTLLLHAEHKPVKPKTLKLIHENTTPSAIIQKLSECYPTAALLSDEAHTVFNSRAMSDLGLLNKAWDGGAIHFDRVTDGSIVIDDPSLTLGLFVQREVVIKYFEGKGELARSSGFLARCYVIAPPPAAGTRYLAYAVEASQECLTRFYSRCVEILQSHLCENATTLPEKTTLQFSPEAQSRWEREHDAIESNMLPGGFFQNFKDFGSKHADKIARLSALLHYFEGQEGPISLETLERSIAISNWFATEFIRYFTPAPQPTQEQTDANLLVIWLANQYRMTGLTAYKKTEILQCGPNSLRNKIDLNTVLLFLYQRNIVAEGKFPNDKTIYVFINVQYFNQHLAFLCQYGIAL